VPPIVKPADAPVSYPFLWDTPQQNLVQWIGLPNGGPLGILSLSRNVGEVLGVFGGLSIPDDPPITGYPSTVRVLALRDIEDWLRTLRSPKWPADFPPIDQAAAAQGQVLYRKLCLECHTMMDREHPEAGNVAVLSAVGTDPRTAENFLNREGPSGKLEGAFVNVVNVVDFDQIPEVADAATMLRNEVIGTIVGAWKEPPPDDLSQVRFTRAAPLAAAPAGPPYKGRPLDGIWATAPYLHNGSVPNLYELLLPASERSTSFPMGVRTFDPERVGFLTDVEGFPEFRVHDADGHPIPGNSNAGHEYGTDLDDEQRRQLLEYLKSL
jgi:hypothetical protein